MTLYQKIAPSLRERPQGRDTTVPHEQSVSSLGVELLTREQALGVARTFGEHLRAGLGKNKLSLKMYPTHLHPLDLRKIPPNESALVVEVGGTHIRSSLVALDSAGEPKIATESLRSEKKKKYESSNEFFDEVALTAQNVLAGKNPKTIGVIWSFPADAVSVANGVDLMSTSQLSKELVIPHVERKPVGDAVIEALRRNGIDIPLNLPRAALNDTAAVLLANGATLGGIVATGFNLAFAHGGQIYNMEAGGFSEIPQTDLTLRINEVSEYPGEHLLEKQVSGNYIGAMFNEALHGLGIIDRTYSSADMSAVLSGQLFLDNPTVREIAVTLRDRSAQLVGAAIAGTVQEFPDDFSLQDVVIPIDGSFFGKTPGYKEAVEAYAADLLGSKKKISCTYVQESGMKGAGVAALGLLGQN